MSGGGRGSRSSRALSTARSTRLRWQVGRLRRLEPEGLALSGTCKERNHLSPAGAPAGEGRTRAGAPATRGIGTSSEGQLVLHSPASRVDHERLQPSSPAQRPLGSGSQCCEGSFTEPRPSNELTGPPTPRKPISTATARSTQDGGLGRRGHQSAVSFRAPPGRGGMKMTQTELQEIKIANLKRTALNTINDNKDKPTIIKF